MTQAAEQRIKSFSLDHENDTEMNDALVTEIARQIFTEQIVKNWKFYGLLLGLYLVAFVAQKFIGPYFQKRGETLATKADFELIKKQLEETTKTAKGIELSLSHKDWSLKEYKVLRRTKLEELMVSLYDTEQWLEKEANATLFSAPANAERSPVVKLRMLSLLYFPELAASTSTIFQIHQKQKMTLIEASGRVGLAKHQVEIAKTVSLEEHQKKLDEQIAIVKNSGAEILPLQLAFIDAIHSFEIEAEKVMRTAIAVETS